MLPLMESETVEFKLIWKDDYMKQICGFANGQGGRMYLGVNDNGIGVGLENTKRLLEELPNKILTLIGLIIPIDILEIDSITILRLTITSTDQPVSFRGKFYIRSGTITQELNGSALQNFLLKRNNISWDEFGEENATLDDIDVQTVKRFVHLAIAANRLHSDALNYNILELFNSLHLLDNVGRIKRCALLAFATDPMKFFPSFSVKIGRFTSDSNIIFQDVMEKNLFVIAEEGINILKSKYLKASISYTGIHRTEEFEIPESVLREALLNALIHRDYTGAITQIKVYNDKLSFWNAGLLPEGLRPEMLLKQHTSIPRNRSLANLFFKSGLIESWGRGTLSMAEECQKKGLPTPQYYELAGGFSVDLTKTVTPPVAPPVAPPVTPPVTMQIERLLAVMDEEKTRDELQNLLGISDKKYFLKSFLKQAINAGFIEMTDPLKPNNKNQKYRITKRTRGN